MPAGWLKRFPFSACKPRFQPIVFYRKNWENSHFCAGRPQKTSYFTCPERHAARLDALGPSKSIENIDVFSDFYVFCCSPTPSNAQETVLEPFRSHPFWCHFGAIWEPIFWTSRAVTTGPEALEAFGSHLGAIWSHFGVILGSIGTPWKDLALISTN